MNRPTPHDQSRDFRIDEMFFSTTDRKGVIRTGNDVFVRVSGYERSELVGRPHNLIRHPDMPRAVFRLVWKHLRAGTPVAGFVKNLAKDGRYYWVVAYLTPIDGGYLSIRFKPSSPLQPAVEGVYREMLQGEHEAEKRGLSREAAMDEADRHLRGALRKYGFDGYEAFMRTMLHEELKCRDVQIAQQRLALFPAELPAGTVAPERRARLEAIYASGRQAYGQVNRLYAQLDEFAALNEQLREKSAYVLGLTKDFRFIAFNAALRASRLGEEARGLTVIAEYLGSASASTTKNVALLTAQIDAILAKLRAVTFNLAAARLQIEMALSFCAELAEGRHADDGTAAAHCRMIEDLQRAFAVTVERAVQALLELERELDGLANHAEDMRRLVLTLQVAQVGGLVEAQRLQGDDSFRVMFGDLRHGVDGTKQALGELEAIGQRLSTLAGETPAISATIHRAVQEMDAQVRALAEEGETSGPPPAVPAQAGSAKAAPGTTRQEPAGEPVAAG